MFAVDDQFMHANPIRNPTDELRVLVADDNADAATSLCVLLGVLGCHTAVAFDGDTALSLTRLYRPHISFIDMDMPVMDGCEVVARVRAELPEHQQIFICLTGRSEPQDEERCLASGFHVFVPKPLELDALVALLAKCRERALVASPSC